MSHEVGRPLDPMAKVQTILMEAQAKAMRGIEENYRRIETQHLFADVCQAIFVAQGLLSGKDAIYLDPLNIHLREIMA